MTSASKSERRKVAAAEMLRVRQRQRRNRLLLSAGFVVAVVLIVGVAAVVAFNRNGSGAATTSATSKLTHTLETIPAATFNAVGAGATSNPPKVVSNPKPMSENGKPRVLYVGAEYCPFCAAERWAVVTALARFGTFTNLGQTTSSAADEFPNTPTLSFHGATYSSRYLVFKGYETESNQVQGGSYAPLDTLSAADNQIWKTYDFPPYETGDSASAIPFIDFGGQRLQNGVSYDPGLLKGLTHQQVADDIANPDTTISKAVLGTANTFTAVLCGLTRNQPSDVCSSSAVTAAKSNLS